MSAPPFRLRELPAPLRLGLTCLLLVIAGGFAASVLHLRAHHENRDAVPGLSLDDLRGAYAGLRTRAPLLVALERGHPPELPAAERELLLTWLRGERLSEGFDDLDLGEHAPAEVLAAACTSCHSRTSDAAIGKTLPLDYWDDVRPLSISRDVPATDAALLLASTHTHALSLGVLSLVLSLLVWCTGCPRLLRTGLPLLAGGGLLLDLASWWLARGAAGWTLGILVGGALFAAATGVQLGALLFELWRPRAAS